jgi:nucleoid DNA-binding protein
MGTAFVEGWCMKAVMRAVLHLHLQSPRPERSIPSTMATAKKSTPPAASKKAARTAAPAAKKAASPAPASKTASAVKPIKEAFTKAALIAHLAEQAAVDKKAVRAVLAALEGVVLGSVHRKGAGEVSLLGLVKVGVQQVPAKKRRFGKDPFTGEERWFDAKPAGVRIKARALKKLRDAVA